jgi:pyruvate dehydrogenase E2 component (dihydrolipoamide acetyltransferase)
MGKLLEMPKLSPTMEEGVLSAWHKKEGDEVGIDDLLAEVETDKATMEFRSFDKGTLLKILVAAGTQVKLGQPVAVIGATGEDVSALVAQAGGAKAETGATAEGGPKAEEAAKPPAPAEGNAPSADAKPVAPPAKPSPSEATTPAAAATPPQAPPPRKSPAFNVLERVSYAAEPVGNGGGPGAGRVIASPYVRKVAREMGIDLQGALGTGPGGRVVAADLDSLRTRGNAAKGASPASPKPPPDAAEPTSLARVPGPSAALRGPGGEDAEVRPLSPMRKTIARRLTESKTTVPHFYLSIDVDASNLVKLREQINAELASSAHGKSNGESQPLKVSLNDLLIKACAVALVHVPECNASFTPEAILVHKRVDISVAVAIPDGLVTPVLRRADQKSVVAIAIEVRELASRARSRKLKPEEMQDGTFSISNLGMFGIDEFAAVINPPEGAILAVGQVREVPVVADGAVVAGKRLALTLSCDHRVVDGAVGASFLAELRRLIEHPLRVLTG